MGGGWVGRGEEWVAYDWHTVRGRVIRGDG